LLVDHEPARIARVPVEVENDAPRFVQGWRYRRAEGGFDLLSVRFLNFEPDQQRQRFGRIAKFAPEGLDDRGHVVAGVKRDGVHVRSSWQSC
jgi:hypothetical protein